MKRLLSVLTSALVCVAVFQAPRAEASLGADTLTGFVKRVGARVESSKGKLLVTSIGAERGRIEIRLVNDTARERLGFYAYGFGNAKAAKDKAALYEYLLHANSDLAIGSFFVDSDDDVGYKFFLSTREPMAYATFETTYLAMVNVIKERGPDILKMSGPSGTPEGTEPANENHRRKRRAADTGDIAAALPGPSYE